jgi:ACS family hexuronate transporter-like MFS transporter
MIIAKLTGYLLEVTGTYVTVFMMAACAYLTALAPRAPASPRLEPVRLE